jgi:PHP family Zn ribbon phosphoesterase
VSDGIRAVCSHCGAKYRLPVEAAGRTARCKKCGGKFEVPREKNLEDSVLDWLSEGEAEEEVVEKPRVINIPKDEAADPQAVARARGGVIRLKSTPASDSGK